ncbi:MAG: helix-turn-helix transcriptional regulator [Anaerolineales bacterium]|jgi:transcriptional regulator with XRE-family HTH domain|nr:helix-turn-helix transcriptional regulator [Anaerolineales bacterium]
MKIPNETIQRAKLRRLLRELRQKSALRQAEMAKQLDVPQSFVSKYESGTRNLDILELRQICQLMGISLQDFVKKLEDELNETK